MSYFVINGDQFEFSGEFEEDLRDVTVESDASHTGVNYPKISTKKRMVRVDQIKINPAEVEALTQFINSCAAIRDKFVVTFYRDTRCADLNEPGNRVDFFGCLIEGDPKYRHLDNEITGFEFSFEERRASGSATANANFGQVPAGVI